jgi:hypothetical protein
MANITMYDTVTNSLYPKDAQAVAGYVNGEIGDQPNYQWLVRNFPQAQHLSIALSAGTDADCLDIENGAASPADAAAWYARQVARGITRPCFYASADLMQSDILPIIKASGFSRGGVRLWSAHYGRGEHICGPVTCGLMSSSADGTQWTSLALGLNLDQSLLKTNFFVMPPANGYGPPGNAQAQPGRTSAYLYWDPPMTGALPPPAEYTIFIYQGTVCNTETLVAPYPRTFPAGNECRCGGLKRMTRYTAHVVASGPNNTLTIPDSYASVTFTTG